jgi:hypothetical protein
MRELMKNHLIIENAGGNLDALLKKSKSVIDAVSIWYFDKCDLATIWRR